MSAPLVDLAHPWPLGAPHSETGWRPPLSRVRLANGLEVILYSWGDAVPGGYNGGFALRTAGGLDVGRLEYASGGGVVLIAMVEVRPAFRGSGASDALLMRLVAEFPDERVSAGLTTPDGTRWWKRVRPYLRTVEED